MSFSPLPGLTPSPKPGRPVIPGLPPEKEGPALGDPMAPDVYTPGAYEVPTDVPAWLTGGVAAFRNRERLGAPIVKAVKVPYTRTREVPIETPQAPAGTTAGQTATPAESTAHAAQPTTQPAGAPGTPQASQTTQAPAETTAAVTSAKPMTKTVTETGTVTKNRVQGIPGLTTEALLNAVTFAALFNGIASACLNGYAALKGQQTVSQAVSNVVGDASAGAVGGAAGLGASAGAMALLAGVVGPGMPITAVGVGAGMLGYWLGERLFRRTSLYQSLTHDAQGLLSGVSLVRGPLPPGAQPPYAP